MTDRHASSPLVVSLLAVSAAFLASCGSSSSTTCASDTNGNTVCSSYAYGYPYDYAYTTTGTTGYSSYSIDTYDDAVAYEYALTPSSIGNGSGADAAAPDAGAPRRNVPELLDKANRGASAINAGIRTTLDPIKDIIKTPPAEGADTITYGPMDRGPATYQFTMRRYAANRFGWKLEARPVGTSQSFVLVGGGTILTGDTPRRGRGVFGADYDAQSGADSSVHAKGKLLLGFATGSTTKILHYVLNGYTPNPTAITPLDSVAIAWHRDGANDVRVVLRTNLEETESAELETVAVKLRWRRDEGARAQAVATGGDIPPGSRLTISTCVPASLDRASQSTSAMLCSSVTACMLISGSAQITCPSGLQSSDEPDPDPMAADPPSGIPEVPDAPSAVPDGTQTG